VLLAAATISRLRKEYATALSHIERSVALAEAGGYSRLLSEAQVRLADIYRDKGDLSRAEQLISRAVAATQASGELWAVPQRLHDLARLKVALASIPKPMKFTIGPPRSSAR
jgi:hypothetical protein